MVKHEIGPPFLFIFCCQGSSAEKPNLLYIFMSFLYAWRRKNISLQCSSWVHKLQKYHLRRRGAFTQFKSERRAKIKTSCSEIIRPGRIDANQSVSAPVCVAFVIISPLPPGECSTDWLRVYVCVQNSKLSLWPLKKCNAPDRRRVTK